MLDTFSCVSLILPLCIIASSVHASSRNESSTHSTDISIAVGKLVRKERNPGGMISSGNLGAAGTTIFTGSSPLSGTQDGVEVAINHHFGDSNQYTLSVDYLTPTSKRNQNAYVTNSNAARIVIPFYNTGTGNQDSVLVNQAGVFSGNASRLAYNDFNQLSLLAKSAVVSHGNWNMALLGGYTTYAVKDNSALNFSRTVTGGGGPNPIGTQINSSFSSNAKNRYNAAVIGTALSYEKKSVTLSGTLKAAFGSNKSTLTNRDPESITLPGGGTVNGTVTGNNPNTFNFEPGTFSKNHSNTAVILDAAIHYKLTNIVNVFAQYDFNSFGKMTLSRNSMALTESASNDKEQTVSYYLQSITVGINASFNT